MPETFLSPENAALCCNLSSPTAEQETILDQLCTWADAIIINLIGHDPRGNPDYAGDKFGGLQYVATHLVAREFFRITNQSHGLDSGTFNGIAITYNNSPDLNPMAERVLQNYWKITFY